MGTPQSPKGALGYFFVVLFTCQYYISIHFPFFMVETFSFSILLCPLNGNMNLLGFMPEKVPKTLLLRRSCNRSKFTFEAIYDQLLFIH